MDIVRMDMDTDGVLFMRSGLFPIVNNYCRQKQPVLSLFYLAPGYNRIIMICINVKQALDAVPVLFNRRDELKFLQDGIRFRVGQRICMGCLLFEAALPYMKRISPVVCPFFQING